MNKKRKAGSSRERVYAYVRDRIQEGLPPTVRDVQEAMGFRAVQSAREHLERLVQDGLLLKTAGVARGYALPDATPSASVPLLGRVQAGQLSAAIEDHEGSVPVSARSSDGLFALRVRGESMSGLGILPDDIVVVRTQPNAESGDIVVALVEDEATVKTLRKRRGHAELHPANPDFDIIIPPPEDLRILGKVIEVRRTLG